MSTPVPDFWNFKTQPQEYEEPYYSTIKNWMDSIEKGIKNNFGTNRGLMPSGADLNTYIGVGYGGAYVAESTVVPTLVNAPPFDPAYSSSTSIENRSVFLVFNGGETSGTTQLFFAPGQTWYRTAPYRTYSSWVNLSTPNIAFSKDISGTNTASVLKLNELPPGNYYTDYLRALTENNTPVYKGIRLFGTITIHKVSGSRWFMIFQSMYGVVNNKDQPYTVWIKGMDQDPNENKGKWRDNWVLLYASDATPPPVNNLKVGPSNILRATGAVVKMGHSLTVKLNKNMNELRTPASTTKILCSRTLYDILVDENNARTTPLPVNTLLDQEFTVLPTDPKSQPTWSGNDIPLAAGDILTYREAITLFAVPSHNQCCEIVARAAGEKISGAGTPREKFLARMNQICTDLNFAAGTFFDNPSGASSNCKITPSNLADLAYNTFRFYPEIVTEFAKTECAVAVRGTNPRTLNATMTIRDYGMENFPDWVAGKAGTWGEAAFVMMWRNESNGFLGVTAVMGTTPTYRFQDLRTATNLVKDNENKAWLV